MEVVEDNKIGCAPITKLYLFLFQINEAEKAANCIKVDNEFDPNFNPNLLTWKYPRSYNMTLLHYAAWVNNTIFLKLIFAEEVL